MTNERFQLSSGFYANLTHWVDCQSFIGRSYPLDCVSLPPLQLQVFLECGVEQISLYIISIKMYLVWKNFIDFIFIVVLFSEFMLVIYKTVLILCKFVCVIRCNIISFLCVGKIFWEN